jgi:uncharacterized LabA/DUF88 family protein
LAETRLKIAVFIDFDNIEIGVKTTLGGHFDVGAVLEAIKERGEVVTKIAYGDWTRAGDYSRSLTQHAIHMVQRNLTPGGDKNGADINLALDALEMAFTHSHINAFVIVGGDSDFMALVEKLKQYDRKVFVVGGRAFTSTILQRNCTEFIAYENVVGVTASRKPGVRGAKTEATIEKAVPLIRRALKVLADREVSPQLGVLKSTLLQLDSTFSEREYGASTFRDFVQRLARGGYVSLKGTDRNIYVELSEKEGGPHATAPSTTGTGRDGEHQPVDGEPTTLFTPTLDGENVATSVAESASAPAASAHSHSSSHVHSSSSSHAAFATTPPPSSERTAAASAGGPSASAAGAAVATSPAPVPTSPQAQGTPTGGGSAAGQAELLRLVLDVFQRPGTVSRWPLYLRQVKQLLRTADESFDERRFGFSGIVEALRFCQREGVFRLDRDRQGVLRVYPGPVLQRNAPATGHPTSEQTDGAGTDHDHEPTTDSITSSGDEPAREPKPMELFRVTDADVASTTDARAAGKADSEAKTEATASAIASEADAMSAAAGEEAPAPPARTAAPSRRRKRTASAPAPTPTPAPKAAKKTAAAKPQGRTAAKKTSARKNTREK